eukprot:Hpha_TRINITY_DN15365_c3_g5::TRINITY_DN15365_c3_g5_i1::g.89967::m.89967
MRAALLFLTLLPAAAAYTEAQWAQFEDQVKTFVKNATRGDQLAVSVGWVDQFKNLSFAAGKVNQTDGTRRPPTTDDTYLYGSGSKVLTSVAVLSLVERGVIGLHDPVHKHVDRLLGLYANTSLAQLWGPAANIVTVKELLHMSSGIIDYDNPSFDDWMLLNDSQGVVSPVLFVQYPSFLPQNQRFYCIPGTCRAYSSTGYVLLGLLLTEHSGQDDWTKVKTSDFWHPEVKAAFENDIHFFTDEPLPKWLTVPGVSATYSNASGTWVAVANTVAEQNSSIVGFTCANAVTTPHHMARFYHALLHDQTVLKPSTLQEMESFQLLSAGWAKGYVSYGLGLMQGTVDALNPVPQGFNRWGAYMGHGGVVFGYNSLQAYAWGVNATFSVAFNADFGFEGSTNDGTLACQIVEAGSNILYGAGVDLNCWHQWQ